jgi:hypothetical protein
VLSEMGETWETALVTSLERIVLITGQIEC